MTTGRAIVALAIVLAGGCGGEAFRTEQPDADRQDAGWDATALGDEDAFRQDADVAYVRPDACTPNDAGFTWTCTYGLQASPVHALTQHCIDHGPGGGFGWDNTPAACRGCIETYTCACILDAKGGVGAPCWPGTVRSCDEMQGGPYVHCSQD